ncbi:MarR family winged helix-turn-helix transcriptional regulator [Streptomyces liangshanensis]|uniref:MarR family winged helix-turn-helix transcriptional regulator n=1 Tax=Streptomyces liangshanensis TaxID=2717324 RepID=UPI0036DC2BFF
MGGELSVDDTAGAAETGDGLMLDLQLCFDLLKASRAFNGVYRNLLGPAGLTYPQYLTMMTLWEHREMQVKQLGEVLRLDSGTLSPLLKRLEAAGLVTRERNAADERSVTIRPTADGQALRERVREVPAQIVAATGLSPEQAADLRDRLRTLTDSLDTAARAYPASD